MAAENFSSTVVTPTEDFFAGVFENRLSKSLSMSFAITAIPFVLTFSLSMIWYERQFEKKTIVNKIVSLICWTLIEFTVLVTIPDLPRYVIGPLPELGCWIHQIVKNGIVAKLLLLQTSLIISRYVCIFWLKNTAAVDEQLWGRIIFTWSTVFGYGTQFVFIFLPGKHPVNYYVCVGKNPQEGQDELPIKFNIYLYVIAIISLIIHLYCSLKISIYKNKVNTYDDLPDKTCLESNAILKSIENQSLLDCTTISFNMALLVLFGMVGFKLGQVKPEELNNFPNYFLLYWIQLVNSPLMSISLFAMCYLRDEKMRRTVLREIKNSWT
jgi:hypothetical protein